MQDLDRPKPSFKLPVLAPEDGSFLTDRIDVVFRIRGFFPNQPSFAPELLRERTQLWALGENSGSKEHEKKQGGTAIAEHWASERVSFSRATAYS